MKKKFYSILVALLACSMQFAYADGIKVATFEDVQDITAPVDGHISVATEDDDEREFFVSGDFAFASKCMSDWDYWYWFGYASRTETKYESLDDQWNNIVGGGYDGSANYGIAFAAAFNGPCYATLLTDEPAVVPGFYITNSSYAEITSGLQEGDTVCYTQKQSTTGFQTAFGGMPNMAGGMPGMNGANGNMGGGNYGGNGGNRPSGSGNGERPTGRDRN